MKLSKTVVSINPNLDFQQIYTTHNIGTAVCVVQNSVKKTMIFRPTNQLNVKETKGVVH